MNTWVRLLSLFLEDGHGALSNAARIHMSNTE